MHDGCQAVDLVVIEWFEILHAAGPQVVVGRVQRSKEPFNGPPEIRAAIRQLQ
jgi:hypothetical protein